MAVVLFHRTFRDLAERILREGFEDGGGQYMDLDRRGIWLSDVPWEGIAADENDALLRVTFACKESDLARFEWINDPPIGCREWLLPSAVIKKRGRVELLSLHAWDALLDAV